MFKIVNNQPQSYIKLKTSHRLHRSLFIPERNRLLVYDTRNLLCEYDVQGTYSTGNQFVVLNLYIYNVIYA